MTTTWNPSDKASDIVLSGSNLIETLSSQGNFHGVRSTDSRSTGLLYAEIVCNVTTGQVRSSLGLDDGTLSLGTNSAAGSTIGSWAMFQDDGHTTFFYHNSVQSGTPTTLSNTNVLNIAWNANNGKLWFGVNNTWNTGNPATDTSPTFTSVTGTLFLVATNSTDLGTQQFTLHADSSNQTYSPPSGFTSWSSTAQATAAIIGTGTVSLNATVQKLVVQNIAGSATVSATLGQIFNTNPASIVGAGTVTASTSLIGTLSAAITGAGTVSASAAMNALISAGITGAGTVGATAFVRETGSAAISGAGAVVAPTSVIGATSSSIQGSAIVTANAYVIVNVRAAIQGSGTISVAIEDPASAANPMGDFTSNGMAQAYNAGFIPGEVLGATNPCLQNVIPSYLYVQYRDDDDLQAFVAAYNSIAQEYVTWMNDVMLPVYTGSLLVGDLLDWVALGLYGVVRPSLTVGNDVSEGPYDSYQINGLAYNARRVISAAIYVPVDDDIFKRVLTWKLYKGDGKVIDIRWLKRRIYRFLYGVGGTDVNCGDTSTISIAFEFGAGVTITVVTDTAQSLAEAPLFDTFRFNDVGFDLGNNRTKITQSIQTYTHGNQIHITLTGSPPNAAIFKEAMDQGVLDMPFQFTTVVTIA